MLAVQEMIVQGDRVLMLRHPRSRAPFILSTKDAHTLIQDLQNQATVLKEMAVLLGGMGACILTYKTVMAVRRLWSQRKAR